LTDKTRITGNLAYKRGRFSTGLPTDRLYTRSHYWLREAGPAVWRIGLTKFATRLLGDIIEYQFEVEAGSHVAFGQQIGSIEGFKAVSDICTVAEGDFGGNNPALGGDITLIESDPYEGGWLYQVHGRPGPDGMDANGYAAILNEAIDKTLACDLCAEGDG